MKPRILAAAAIVAAFALPAQQAWAVGEDDEGADKVTQCADGMVWDEKEEKCVPVQESQLGDQQLLDNGRALAYAGRYGEAITVLNMVSDRNDPEVWNFLGYSTRKSGDIAKGIGFYQQALAIDPDYTLARAYMGEAYLDSGDRNAAVAQLGEIERRDGRTGKAYAYLSEALEGKAIY